MSMKIRTKLVLLLSGALIVTMLVSTYLRIRWTRSRLEDQLRDSASDAAAAIASDLATKLHSGMDKDEIEEVLKEAQRRHGGADLELTINSDEDTVSIFSLPQSSAEAKVANKPSSSPHPAKPLPLRRDEARRAYYDHGGSSRPPGQRFVEPLWRTPDKPDSDRWPARSRRPSRPSRRSPCVRRAPASAGTACTTPRLRSIRRDR
jgi:hypothetical protein